MALTARKEKRRVFLENIWLIALIILIVGIFSALVEFHFFQQSFIGEIMISGGFFGILVYLIVGRHEKYVLREEVLGLRPDLTLVDQLAGQATTRDYFYHKRTFEWELHQRQQNDTKWAVKLKDTIDLKVERDIREIVMMRECDVELTAQSRTVVVTDKTTNSTTSVQLQHSAELSTVVKSYYLVRHDFIADHEYEAVSSYSYPPNMKKDADYIEMKTPVYTGVTDIRIKLPSGFDINSKGFDCYTMDLRYVRTRTLQCNCDTVNRTVNITSNGAVLAGETIVFKYFPKEEE